MDKKPDKKPEDIGADFALEVIDTVDDSERAAFDAIRRFVESVDEALPGGGKKGGPRRRVELVEAALKMLEQLLGVSNDIAHRVTESVRQALPDIERTVRATSKQAGTSKKSGAAKKAPAKKAPARKAATAKKGSAKKRAATAKKAPAKKRTGAAKKATAKKAAKRS